MVDARAFEGPASFAGPLGDAGFQGGVVAAAVEGEADQAGAGTGSGPGAAGAVAG